MPDISSDTLILALKTIFSVSGVPTILISDNGHQYCSEEFKQFSLEWLSVHKTSSSCYPRGNSCAERAVGVVKEIYSKYKDDFLLGLLVHQSTPLLYPNAKSPAELFLGRKIATNIPYIPFGTAMFDNQWSWSSRTHIYSKWQWFLLCKTRPQSEWMGERLSNKESRRSTRLLSRGVRWM